MRALRKAGDGRDRQIVRRTDALDRAAENRLVRLLGMQNPRAVRPGFKPGIQKTVGFALHESIFDLSAFRKAGDRLLRG